MQNPRRPTLAATGLVLKACLQLALPLALSGHAIAAGLASASSARELAELPLATLLDAEVTGASRFPTRRSAAAAAVTVITRDEIRALGHRTLGEALRSVRGAALAGDRAYDYLGVRGFAISGDYNTRVLLLIDGNRVNDALYDQAFIGSEFPLDLDHVERIEFVPGAGSAVYGANALFGVVNVITRSVQRQGGELALGAGSFGERRLRGLWQQRTGPGEGWQLGGSRTLARGETLAPPPDAAAMPAIGGLDGLRRSALYARWDHGPWHASLLHADRIKHVPLSAGLVYGSPLNRFQDRLRLASLQHERELDAQTQLTTRIHAGDYRYIGDYEIDYPPPTHNRDISQGRWWGLEARVASTRWTGHRLVAGFEWQRSPILLQQSFDIAPGTDVYIDDRRRSARAAVFAEDQLSLGADWTLHLGGRYDTVQGRGHAASPRVALAWRPAEGWSLKAIHGGAFRSPNVYEAYYEADTAAGYLRNPDLKRERVTGDELSAEWQPRPEWRVSGSLYRNRTRGLVTLVYDPATERYRFVNAEAIATHGAELELEHLAGALRWRLNASSNHGRVATVDGMPAMASAYPARMLKGVLVLPLPHDVLLGLEGLALSRRGAAPGHALANLTLSGTFGGTLRGLQWQASVRNLFDRAAQDPGDVDSRLPALPQPRRQLRLEVSWAFGD